MSDRAGSLDPAFEGEILGAAVVIERAPGLARLPVRGTLVDETLHTFLLRLVPGDRIVRVPKTGVEGTILLGGKELPLRGDALRVRPEDRTKRLAWRGRRRHA
jgi:RNase P/RNase MRP subunit p29